MYERLNPSLVEGNLLPKAREFALKGGDPKEVLNTCLYLQFFSPMRTLSQTLAMRAYDELSKNDRPDFEVYRLLCIVAIKFFLKDSRVYNQGIALFAIRKMKETSSEKKHEKQIKECLQEMRRAGVPQEMIITV